MNARFAGSLPRVVRKSFLLSLCPVVLAWSVSLNAHAAAGYDDVLPDANTLAQMEQQAATAQPKEQCYLYTEVVHGLTEIAGKQLADGQQEQAAATLQHLQQVSAKMQELLLTDAKKLKNAEQLLEHTTRRLGDMLHLTSNATRAKLQTTLQRLNEEHAAMLNEVFSK